MLKNRLLFIFFLFVELRMQYTSAYATDYVKIDSSLAKYAKNMTPYSEAWKSVLSHILM